MKIVVFALPRTGSTAYCSLNENDFGEYLHILETILPQNKKNMLQTSDAFFNAFENRDYVTAFENLPKYKVGENYFIDRDENANPIEMPHPLTLSEYLTLQPKRWDNVKKKEAWCLKIMRGHAIDSNLLDEIVLRADKKVAILRRDKFLQAMSLTICHMLGQWTNLKANIESIDYKVFDICCRDIMVSEQWVLKKIDQYNLEILHYEELDLSQSNFQKSDVSIKYDENKCKEIFNKYF